jgi:pimeloyl-ACP methyl ester carboxylesterase
VFDVHESPHPIVLVPGFWLGAWAWDELGTALRADGHEITAQTLPGLESADADRSAITLSDHVDAVCETVTAAGAPVVLAVHSAAGFPGYAASDRIREKIAAKVYVDTGPGIGRSTPTSPASTSRLPSRQQLAAETSTASTTSSSKPSAGERCRSRAPSSARPWG